MYIIFRNANNSDVISFHFPFRFRHNPFSHCFAFSVAFHIVWRQCVYLTIFPTNINVYRFSFAVLLLLLRVHSCNRMNWSGAKWNAKYHFAQMRCFTFDGGKKVSFFCIVLNGYRDFSHFPIDSVGLVEWRRFRKIIMNNKMIARFPLWLLRTFLWLQFTFSQVIV